MRVEKVLKAVLSTRVSTLALRILERTPVRSRLYSTSMHPTKGLLLGSGSMAEDWDQRAREGARFYVAPDYWASEEEFDLSGKQEVEAHILKGLSFPPDSRVLEIGCGLGRLLKPLARRFAEVHGVDISEEMITQCSERLRSLANVHVQQSDGSLATFPDGYFDFCFSWRVFQHIPEKRFVLRYLQEGSRVLKPGGTLRFDVAKDEGGSRRREGGGTWFGVVFTEDEVRRCLESCGLDTVEIRTEQREQRHARLGQRENWIVTGRRRGNGAPVGGS
jgi:ubiquinone/menaquinone biosynthesis C-methylase UbiE